MPREGILVKPYQRLNEEQIEQVHRISMEILSNPGILCFNHDAADIFAAAGAEVIPIVSDGPLQWSIKIPESIIMEAIASAPKKLTLGARDENNALILDGWEPRVRFASGAETNNWLEVDFETFVSKKDSGREANFPVFRVEKGSVDRLGDAAHLCENLDAWDGFLRPVNIQDDDITEENKDVNKFFAAFNNTSKHVMAGLNRLDQLDNVLKMAYLIAGGKEKFQENPIFSLITSIIKSPLQLVDDTTQKTIEIARRKIPLVISSAPQGGSTAPIQEAGIVAQINAEILAGVTLAQLANRGAPVIYGSVPGRANMHDLSDSYGAPEFSQYNIDCVQMARHYGLPCYSSGGVSDATIPGIEATVERLFTQIMVALSGPQYLHYAFGLMERTTTFCPVQAVLDNTHLGMIKNLARQPDFSEDTVAEMSGQIQKVMNSSTRLFTRFARSALRSGQISPAYPFESKGLEDETLFKAKERTDELMALPRNHIEKSIIDRVFKETPGLLTRLKTR